MSLLALQGCGRNKADDGKPNQMSNSVSYKTALVQPKQIEHAILLLRGQRVMLDRDLAALYGVTTGNLNKAVQRNLDRFPADFMFQLTDDETEALIFQFGRSKGRGGRRFNPYVFTQEGVAMLSDAPCRVKRNRT